MSNVMVPVDRADFLPAMTQEDARNYYDAIRTFVKSQLVEGCDYGVIPGTEKKGKGGEDESVKTLLKPGAEKLLRFFGLNIEEPVIQVGIEDWTGAEHGGEALFYYRIQQTVTSRSGAHWSQLGSCNSCEKKYRWRNQDRTCPKCNMAAVKHSKKEEGGWYCYGAIGGCGLNFREETPEITCQKAGRIANPDIADVANTVLKQAQKRALVAVTLVAVNASEFFTQDMEDHEPTEGRRKEPSKGEPKSEPKQPPVVLISKEQWEQIQVKLQAKGVASGMFLNVLCKRIGRVIERPSLIPVNKFQLAMNIADELPAKEPPKETPKESKEFPKEQPQSTEDGVLLDELDGVLEDLNRSEVDFLEDLKEYGAKSLLDLTTDQKRKYLTKLRVFTAESKKQVTVPPEDDQIPF